ncbi:hypothetical protein N9P54_01255, partial [Planktomarina sp.]|nr:hypothetical protein [Planktomarina sp.]
SSIISPICPKLWAYSNAKTIHQGLSTNAIFLFDEDYFLTNRVAFRFRNCFGVWYWFWGANQRLLIGDAFWHGYDANCVITPSNHP